MKLSAEPKDARPIEAFFDGGKDDPVSISLPVLPAIRGRVIDPEVARCPRGRRPLADFRRRRHRGNAALL